MVLGCGCSSAGHVGSGLYVDAPQLLAQRLLCSVFIPALECVQPQVVEEESIFTAKYGNLTSASDKSSQEWELRWCGTWKNRRTQS